MVDVQGFLVAQAVQETLFFDHRWIEGTCPVPEMTRVNYSALATWLLEDKAKLTALRVFPLGSIRHTAR